MSHARGMIATRCQGMLNDQHARNETEACSMRENQRCIFNARKSTMHDPCEQGNAWSMQQFRMHVQHNVQMLCDNKSMLDKDNSKATSVLPPERVVTH